MSKDCVILLHGLGRTKISMLKMERALKKAGYITNNVDYPSTRYSVEELATKYVGPAITHCRELSPEGKVHFVTHSMGGILVRAYFQGIQAPSEGKVIMLAPPNKGSELAEYFKQFTAYKWILGPAGLEMGTSESTPKKLESIPLDIGIIGGTKSYVPWFSKFLSGPHDGRVSLDHTKLDEMKAFASVEADHSVIMDDNRVIAQVLYFLENGNFEESESP